MKRKKHKNRWEQLSLLDYLNRIEEVLKEPLPENHASFWGDLARETDQIISQVNGADSNGKG